MASVKVWRTDAELLADDYVDKVLCDGVVYSIPRASDDTPVLAFAARPHDEVVAQLSSHDVEEQNRDRLVVHSYLCNVRRG